jgi:hypothetical protein
MVKIKVTDILLNPLVKTDYTVVIEDDEEESLNNAIVEILRAEQTEKEDLNTLIRKYNSSARRFNKGLSNTIFIYTHPAEGVVLRTVIEIYKQIAKEVSL